MEHSKEESFSKFRSYIWPIYARETKKLIPMIIMLFLVCFNYSILRNLKDALVITARNSGAEVIPFIKVWVMLPTAIIVTMAFSFLTNHYSRKSVFQLILSLFLIFFSCFALFIYPNREVLHPHATANLLETILPVGFKGLIAMFRNWTLTGFYVISELWGSMVLSVLIWGFVNEITKLSEATRFYSVLSISTNVAAIVAGQVAVHFSNPSFDPTLFFGSDAWEQTLMKLLSLVVLSGIGILLSFQWLHRNVLSDPSYLPDDVQLVSKPKNKRMSFKESLVYIMNSRYLLCLAAIVISYNLVINLVELIWKDRLRQLYPSPHDFNIYVNNLTSAMGIISTSVSILMVGLIRKFGWTKTALLTPSVLLLTTIMFFSCLFADKSISPFLSAFFGISPLALAVLLGSVQNCFTKAAKYSVFDATKEMAFIPLEADHKLKGKAAIDGIGSRVGKSGGSLIHQGLLLIFGTLSSSAPYVAVILILVILVWILAVRDLGKAFDKYRYKDTIAHKEEYQ